MSQDKIEVIAEFPASVGAANDLHIAGKLTTASGEVGKIVGVQLIEGFEEQDVPG